MLSERNLFVICCTLVLLGAIAHVSFGQVDQPKEVMDLGFDTLSFNEITRMQRENLSFNLEYPPDLQFDSLQFELMYKGKRLAIVPSELKNGIDMAVIDSRKFKLEVMNDNRVLLRVLLFIHSD